MTASSRYFVYFFFNDTATTEIYTLSLHDALPISRDRRRAPRGGGASAGQRARVRRVAAVRRRYGQAEEAGREAEAAARHRWSRSEEHTSELQSPCNLVCRLLLEKKNKRGLV